MKAVLPGTPSLKAEVAGSNPVGATRNPRSAACFAGLNSCLFEAGKNKARIVLAGVPQKSVFACKNRAVSHWLPKFILAFPIAASYRIIQACVHAARFGPAGEVCRRPGTAVFALRKHFLQRVHGRPLVFHVSVRVYLHRDARGGVPGELLHDGGMDALLRGQREERMPQQISNLRFIEISQPK